MAEQLKLDYDEMMQKAQVLHNQDPSVTIPRVVVPGARAGLCPVVCASIAPATSLVCVVFVCFHRASFSPVRVTIVCVSIVPAAAL